MERRLVVGVAMLIAGVSLAIYWYWLPDGIRNPVGLALLVLPGLVQIVYSELRDPLRSSGLVRFLHTALLSLTCVCAFLACLSGAVNHSMGTSHDPRRYAELIQGPYHRLGTSHFPSRIPGVATSVRMEAALGPGGDPSIQLALRAPISYLRGELDRYSRRATEITSGADAMPVYWLVPVDSDRHRPNLPSDFRVLVLSGDYWPVYGIAVSLKRHEIIYFYTDS